MDSTIQHSYVVRDLRAVTATLNLTLRELRRERADHDALRARMGLPPLDRNRARSSDA